MPDINQQKAQELVTRRSELEKKYLTKGIPIWPLQVAGSRVDEFLFESRDESSFRQNFERASLALDQASNYANLYMAQQREQKIQVVRTMREELERDIPQHYLLEERVEELI